MKVAIMKKQKIWKLGWECLKTWVGIFQVGIFWVRIFQGEFAGWEFPGGSFPDTVSFPNLFISLIELKTFLYLITYLFLFLN